MNDEKLLMCEVATLYYEKKLTQQEIADIMKLSRQTVSRLLGDAVKEKIVEFKIHNPEKDCRLLENAICKKFKVNSVVVCGVSSRNESVRRMMTVKSAAEHIAPLLRESGQKIAVSWGRTIQALIEELPDMTTDGNTVFPLFGATDNVDSCFLSNEFARGLADKLHADVKYAWFPYLPDNSEDGVLLKKTSYYKAVESLWNDIDIAIVGIGNTDVLDLFEQTFKSGKDRQGAIGDIATHFFTENGELLNIYENTLCASAESIGKAKKTIAVASGDAKIKAIKGALLTGLVDILITDEYTAAELVK